MVAQVTAEVHREAVVVTAEVHREAAAAVAEEDKINQPFGITGLNRAGQHGQIKRGCLKSYSVSLFLFVFLPGYSSGLSEALISLTQT